MSFKDNDKIICPYCGRFNESHINMDDPNARPVKGDISVCLYCARVSVYTFSLRKPTKEEAQILAKDTHLTKTIEMIQRGL